MCRQLKGFFGTKKQLFVLHKTELASASSVSVNRLACHNHIRKLTIHEHWFTIIWSGVAKVDARMNIWCFCLLVSASSVIQRLKLDQAVESYSAFTGKFSSVQRCTRNKCATCQFILAQPMLTMRNSGFDEILVVLFFTTITRYFIEHEYGRKTALYLSSPSEYGKLLWTSL